MFGTNRSILFSFSQSIMSTLSAEPELTLHSGPSGLKRLAGLSLAALGVVFGDIGTSPLYAVRECFHGDYGIPVTQGNVLGVLSLLVWAIILIVSLKYLTFIMKADNDGEGGILALTALIITTAGRKVMNAGFWWQSACLVQPCSMVTA